MRRLTFLPIAVLCILTSVLVAQSPTPPPFRGLLDHVTTTTWGGIATGSSEGSVHSISGDGRYVAFSSSEWELVADDFNWNDDVFLRDRTTGVTTRVSVAENGGDANGLSQQAAISTNGRHVVFASGSTDLVGGDSNNHWDVFVRDLDANHTVRVSVATSGAQGNADSYWPSISADGRYVVFVSSSTTFVPEAQQQYGPKQVYLHDRDADGNGVFDDGGTTTSLVSIGIDMASADQDSQRPRVSADGRYVMFESDASNLDPVGNPNTQHHVYLRDRQTEQTRLIDRAVTGGPSSWGINWQVSDMSDDGRFITYSSMSPDIVFFDMNWISQVFLYDAAAEPGLTTSVVSRTSDGTLGNGSSYYTTVSGDGRFVAFMTAAANLAGPLPENSFGLVARDNADGSVTRVDVLEGGIPFDGQYVFNPSLSADGTTIAFQSDAANAVFGGYPYGAHHIFVATALSVSPASASFVQDGGSGSVDATTTAVSSWTAESENEWIVLTDGQGFGAGPRTVQYLVDANPSGIVRNGRIRLGSKFLSIHQEGDGDTTPPVITTIVTGTQVNGWYTSDITVSFEVSDPDSEIVSQSPLCNQTVTFTTDFIYAAPACEATSHGGIATVTVPLRRDTTPPVITVVEPKAAYYAFGTYQWPSYNCSDASGSSVSCIGPYQGSPFDTYTRGRNVFTVTSTDEAGNTATKNVEYIVGTDVCVTTPLAPANMKRWYKFDGTYRDGITGQDAFPNSSAGTFQPGVAGQAWDNFSASNFFWAGDAPSTLAGASGLTVALWVKPRGSSAEYQSLVFNPMQYQVVRWLDGTLRWRFNTTTGFNWVNTGIALWSSAWQHVAVTYNDGVVQTYVNGSLVHSQALSGTLIAGPYTAGLQLAGHNGLNRALNGSMDDVMILDAALPASDIDTLALSGSGSVCAPFASNLALTVPPTVAPGGQYFQVTALLTDASGRPLPNRPLTVTSAVSPASHAVQHVTTNASGSALATFPVDSDLAGGVYEDAIVATFDDDDAFAAASAQSDTTVIATPSLSWLQPANITYGTPLGPDQLRATSTLPGTYVYSPAADTVLDAGVHMLSVTFTPTSNYYSARTIQTMILVSKATPTVEISSAPIWYTGYPRPATVVVHGVGSDELNPFTVLYNGSASAPVNAGTYALQVQYAGSTNYQPVTANGSFVVSKATPIMGAFGDITGTYDGQPHGISVNVAGVNGEWLTPVIVTYNGSTATPVNAGVYAIEARYNGSANYNAVSHTATLTILKAAPSLTWPNPGGITYGTTLGAAQLNATANVAGAFTYSPAAGTVLNAGAHTLTASFTPADAVNYETASANRSIAVAKANPQVTWYSPASIVYGTPLGAAQLNATANVPGTFSYSPASGAVLNAGSQTLSVTFTPDDAANYNGGSANVSLTVSKAAATISWSNPAGIVYGTALGASQLNATASVAGTFSYSPASGAVLNAGSQTLSVTFTPDDAANYNGASANVSLTITKATSTISWSNPADIVYGTAVGASQLNATANVPGTFAYAPLAGTVLGAGAQTLSVTFTPDDAANYNGASANVSLAITKATSTISWSNPADIVYATAVGASQLNATANVPGTFAYAPLAGTVLGAGAQTLSVTFTPDDAANYNGASANVSLTVTKAASTISWSNPADLVYGAALGGSQLNATANVPGTFSYSPTSGAVLNAGSHTLSVTFTPDDAANFDGASTNVSLTVNKAASTISWSNPADLVYGAALGGSQLSATANVPGTFSYSPAAGIVLGAGSYTLVVTFTPADVANYNGSSTSRSLTVVRAPLTITANGATKVYGAPLPAFSATVSGFVNGDSMASLTGTLGFTTTATTSSAVGGYPITPNDVSSPNYTIAFANGTLTVVRASTATAVAPSPNPDGFNQAVTFTAVISVVSPGAGAPTGIMQFFDGTTLLGSAAMVGGSAALTTNGLTAGSHSVSATYTGDASFEPSSGSGSLTVKTAALSSTTAVTSSTNPSNIGQNVTLTATVTAPAGLSGSVAFYDGSTLLATQPLSGTKATLATNALANGGHAITAKYLGNATIPPSTSPAFAQYVKPSGTTTRTSTTALTASPSPAALGSDVTLTATVTGSNNKIPTGQVLFMVNGTIVGQGTLTPIGGLDARTTFSTAALPHGTHAVEAVYLGDAAVRASRTSITLVVN